MFLVVALKILPLLLVIVLGYLAGWFKVFPKPDDAIDTLNRYALYFGFPILIFQGFCNPKMTLPPEAGFYLFHFLVAGLLVAGVAIASRMSPTLTPFRGNLVLGTLFGNVAYLGIPLSLQLLGPQLEGLTLLSVSLQVFLGAFHPCRLSLLNLLLVLYLYSTVTVRCHSSWLAGQHSWHSSIWHSTHFHSDYFFNQYCNV